MSSLLDYFNWL